MAQLLHDLLDERRRSSPQRPAVRRGQVAWTYDELWRRSLGYAEWLRERGVGRGDRVLVDAPHEAATVALIFAVSMVGGVYVVVGDKLPPHRLADVVADAEPALLVTSAADRGRERVPGLGTAVYPVDDLPLGPAVTASYDPAAEGEFGAGRIGVDPVGLLYTSGSTSAPKAVVSTHRQVLFVTAAIGSRLRYRPDDVVLCCLPLSFDYGLYQVFLSVQAGSELVLGDEGDAGPVLVSRLNQWQVSVLPLVPTLAVALAALVARAGRPPVALRMITSSGAALPPVTADRLRELVPGLDVVSMFGLTECKRVSIMEPNGDAVRPGAVGRPLPGTEVFVVDDDGNPLPAGCVGELVVRGEHVMAGYWRAPELTAAKFRRDEFGAPLLFTGDRCRLDDDGYLYFVGRVDDIYKQRGFRVSAVEVEAAAQRLPAVELAAVLPPGDDGEAVVVVRPAVGSSVTAAELLRELSTLLEDFKVPRHCLVVPDLPLGPNGKVDKRALRARLDGLLDRSGQR